MRFRTSFEPSRTHSIWKTKWELLQGTYSLSRGQWNFLFLFGLKISHEVLLSLNALDAGLTQPQFNVNEKHTSQTHRLPPALRHVSWTKGWHLPSTATTDGPPFTLQGREGYFLLQNRWLPTIFFFLSSCSFGRRPSNKYGQKCYKGIGNYRYFFEGKIC